MIKRILTPIDFTNISLNGLKYAFEFAKRLKAELILFHSVESIPQIENSQLNIEEIEEDSKEKLEMICEKMEYKNLLNGINYMFKIRQGETVNSILEEIKESNINLVIMGTRGVAGISNNTNNLSPEIVSKSSCPVLVIPGEYQYKELSNIVYATDLLGDESSDINFIVEFAQIFNAHISFLNIQHGNAENNQEKITKGFSLLEQNEYKNMSFHAIDQEDTLQGINSFADEQEADIIVMSTYRRTLLQNVILQSHTRRLAYYSKIPLLAMHKEKIEKGVEVT